MKHMKKLASLLLALVMVFAMSVTAFATQEGELTGGSITINDAVEGQTYNAYQILYLESYDADSNSYAYKANSAWESWLKTKTSYVSIDNQGYVTWVEDASAADFAKLAQAYATSNSMTADGTATCAEGSTSVTISDLKLGYYLVDTTLGTLCSLDTTNPNVTMREKNKAPTNVKTVKEDSTGNYGSVNDADIGQTVNFKSTITLPKGSEKVVFHDTMSNGLTLDTTSIKVYTDAAMTTELAAGNYIVTTTGLTDGCTFEVSFTQTYLDSLTTTATVYVGYSATVNANAVIGGKGNTNTSKVDYGDENNTTTTPDSTTTTYTWSFDVLKYGNGDETKVLKDAKFVLMNKDKSKVATIVNGKFTGWVDVPAAGEDGSITWPANTELTTDANGKIEIKGLDADTYYLRETQAPAGYNKLANDVEVKIEPTESTDGKTLTLTAVTSKINNNAGTELPSTGGIGTTIFYVLGSVLVIGAAVLLVTKKRMGAAE